MPQATNWIRGRLRTPPLTGKTANFWRPSAGTGKRAAGWQRASTSLNKPFEPRVAECAEANGRDDTSAATAEHRTPQSDDADEAAALHAELDRMQQRLLEVEQREAALEHELTEREEGQPPGGNPRQVRSRRLVPSRKRSPGRAAAWRRMKRPFASPPARMPGLSQHSTKTTTRSRRPTTTSAAHTAWGTAAKSEAFTTDDDAMAAPAPRSSDDWQSFADDESQSASPDVAFDWANGRESAAAEEPDFKVDSSQSWNLPKAADHGDFLSETEFGGPSQEVHSDQESWQGPDATEPTYGNAWSQPAASPSTDSARARPTSPPRKWFQPPTCRDNQSTSASSRPVNLTTHCPACSTSRFGIAAYKSKRRSPATTRLRFANRPQPHRHTRQTTTSRRFSNPRRAPNHGQPRYPMRRPNPTRSKTLLLFRCRRQQSSPFKR